MGLDADADTVDDKPQVVSDAGGASSENDFEYGLCSCFSNCDICICSWCCPCIQFGQNWERLNPHNDSNPNDVFLLYCCAYFWVSAFLDWYFFFLSSTFLRWWSRLEFRRALGYRESPVYDFLSALLCCCCMLAQDGNEIKAFKQGKLSH